MKQAQPKDVSELRPAAAAAEAPTRAGGGEGLQRLAWRAQAGPRGAAAPGRREPADGGRAPPGTPAALRARRAQGRRTRSGRSCATVNEDPSGPRLQPAPALRAGCGLPGAERAAAPGPAGPQGHHVRHEPLLLGRFRPVQRGPQPAASAAHAAEGDSRGRLPHSRRGHGRGLGPDAPRRRETASARTTWQETQRQTR